MHLQMTSLFELELGIPYFGFAAVTVAAVIEVAVAAEVAVAVAEIADAVIVVVGTLLTFELVLEIAVDYYLMIAE